MPVQLRLRPSTFAVATDTTTGEPFNFFLPQSKSSSSRSSVLSACRSIFTKQNVPVVTCDGPTHYNVCTHFGMPIKLFLIRIWPRPPPPPFRREYGFKKTSKITDDPLENKQAIHRVRPSIPIRTRTPHTRTDTQRHDLM